MKTFQQTINEHVAELAKELAEREEKYNMFTYFTAFDSMEDAIENLITNPNFNLEYYSKLIEKYYPEAFDYFNRRIKLVAF
jgi:hypothetical protein